MDKLLHYLVVNPAIALAALSAVIAAVSASVAAFTYSRNATTKRAEFLLALHRTLFVEGAHRGIREQMDCDPPSTEWLQAIREESAAFTDFLNYFELVAYLGENGTLRQKDVDALVGYYLKVMARDAALMAYLRKPTSYENLTKQLSRPRK